MLILKQSIFYAKKEKGMMDMAKGGNDGDSVKPGSGKEDGVGDLVMGFGKNMMGPPPLPPPLAALKTVMENPDAVKGLMKGMGPKMGAGGPPGMSAKGGGLSEVVKTLGSLKDLVPKPEMPAPSGNEPDKGNKKKPGLGR